MKLNRLINIEDQRQGGFFAGMPPSSIGATPPIVNPGKKRKKLSKKKANLEMDYYQPPLFSSGEKRHENT
jgi:hypothetical protein